MGHEQPYYVYVYRFPNRDIFYVGKGQGNRAQDHLDKVIRNIRDCNEHKREIIRSLLQQGVEPLIEIVATFTSEREAYLYEWALIFMTAYAEQLTNRTPQPYTRTARKTPSVAADYRTFVKDGQVVQVNIEDMNEVRTTLGIGKQTLSAFLAGRLQDYDGVQLFGAP